MTDKRTSNDEPEQQAEQAEAPSAPAEAPADAEAEVVTVQQGDEMVDWQGGVEVGRRPLDDSSSDSGEAAPTSD